MATETITDVMEKLGKMEERIEQNQLAMLKELTQIKAKQDHTNGDVNDLKSWRLEGEIKAQARKEFEREQPIVKINATVQNKWLSSDKLVAAAAGLLFAAGYYLYFLAGAAK